ncbi:MAG TPA: MBL fold metallo-hydrolase [Solirubrobacteraceae bacterium]|jgi:hydroxyacylglutathione hydrolase|nr:MBL fold metallo-hydrolase [Solirubrobacteraceae bacterium]
MLIERSSNPRFVSNTYLVADGVGGPGLFVDAGGPVAPLIAAAERLDVTPGHLLLTHHHRDHVCEVGALRERWPKLEVLIHPLERARLGESAAGVLVAADTVEAGEMLRFGTLEVRPLHTPGHTAGMLSFLVSEPSGAARRPVVSAAPGGFTGGEAIVFTGDTLFRGSVGGVRASGHTTFTDLKDSIMGTLMELPAETIIHPGHADATTVGEEWEHNPFIRIWRGVDAEGAEPCVALGTPATLVLSCEDYDGGTKAWVRWSSGEDDIVAGSKVQLG